MAVEEELSDQGLAVLPVVEVDTMIQEKKTPTYITVSITSEANSTEDKNSLYSIELSISSSSWKVYRDLESFQELFQRLCVSDIMYMPLPEGADVTAKSLEHFLQSLLADNCDRIWYCPFITGFIDEQTPSKIKVIQVANITKQFTEVSQEASFTAAKLQDAWRMVATLAQRVKTLETSHQRIHNSFKPKEDGAVSAVDTPLLAGIYRYDDIMAQAAEILKDETDWILGEDGGFASAAPVEVVAVVIPDPPPVIHTYLTCAVLPTDLIPVNEEDDLRDEAIGSVITLLEPHQAQVSYRNSVRAFLARVVRRTLSAKVYETGLHALDCFLPDDPIRLTVLLGRTNLFVENWLPTLADKLSVLADQGSENGKMLLSEMMQIVDDDYMAGEDVQPLSDHSVGRVTATNNSSTSKVFCDVEDTSMEIDCNSLTSVRFLSFLEEVAHLVGKKELFKRSLLLIRGWWTYETSNYLGAPTKNFLSDQALCVMICSIFNQYHATLHQPLQVLSVFLAEFCDVDWGNCAVTIQGIVPFRSVIQEPEYGSVDAEIPETSVTAMESASEPWLRYPGDNDLLSAAVLLKYADVTKSPKSLSPILSCGSKSPVISHGSSSSNIYALPTVSPSTTSVSQLSPLSCYRELDIAAINLSAPGTGSGSEGATDTSQCNPSPKSDLASAGFSTALKASTDLDHPDSPVRRTSQIVVESFQRCAMNIVHPLNQSNMVPLTMPTDRVSKIVQIFEVGAKNLSQALKVAPSEELNVQSAFNRFFKAVQVRFGGGWRPDVFKGAQSMCQYAGADTAYAGDWNTSGQSEADSKSSKFKGLSQPDTIWNQVCYMDLVLTGCVSESAVLALSKEILFERGTLPVGEIGKVLQELTCASSFLGKLKEKFGGLKKFLERFPDEFMICTDHPFNPHVFVKKALNIEELEMVAKGIVPPHLTAKYKKAQRNKKTKPLALGSQSVSPSLTHRTLGGNPGGTSMIQGYNGAMPAGSYRSSPSSNSPHHTLGGRSLGMGAGSTPTGGFSQMQHLQQQNQFYGTVKGHQAQTYSTPGVSSRYRASLSQSILRASASTSGGNSIGNNYHQPPSAHGGFQSGYSLDGPQPQPRPGGAPGSYPSGGSGMRENYAPMRSNSLGIGMVSGDRGSDPYGTDRESMFGLNAAQRAGGRSMSSPNISTGHASPYSTYSIQHPEQSLVSSSNSGSERERERFSDPNRGGPESHLGLFSNAPSPISSQHISYDNQSLSSSYDSETRSFPSHSTVTTGNRSSTSSFLRNLDTPQVLSHTSSPLLFQNVGGTKPKVQLQVEPPSPGSKYGSFLRPPGHHEVDQASPTNSQFSVPLPSPKFDPSKWV